MTTSAWVKSKTAERFSLVVSFIPSAHPHLSPPPQLKLPQPALAAGRQQEAGGRAAHTAPVRVPAGRHIKIKLLHARRDFGYGWDGGKEINGAASPLAPA